MDYIVNAKTNNIESIEVTEKENQNIERDNQIAEKQKADLKILELKTIFTPELLDKYT